MPQRYRDRREAGRILARSLVEYEKKDNLIVLALPRGGVPVAYEVARALSAPLDIILVRKLGVPGQEELAMGAIASGGVRFMNDELVRSLGLPPGVIEEIVQRELRELARREHEYRDNRPAVAVNGQSVILIDDGLATGASMQAAARAMYAQKAREVIVAIPVAATETCDALARVVDRLVCPLTPDPFYAVGMWYEDFTQTSDEEVRALLTAD